MKLCTQCRYCMDTQYGYSNYTVEGSTLSCLQDINPDMEGKEDGYRADESVQKILQAAETCPLFSEGVGPCFDVDGEVKDEDYANEPDIYALLLKRNAKWQAGT